jgi:hypothetical protein
MSGRTAFAAALVAMSCGLTATRDAAATRSADRPTVAVVANVATGGASRPGWPLVVSVALVPGADTTGTPIPPPALDVVPLLLDARGTPVAIAFERLASSEGEGGIRQWAWGAKASATRSLAPGTYRVGADTTGRAGGLRWSFGSLEIQPSGAPASDGGELLAIELEAIAGRHDAALAIVDRLIAADSSDVRAWGLRGDLLLAKDAPDLALAAYGQALRRKGAEDEAIDLRRRQRDALVRLVEKRKTK